MQSYNRAPDSTAILSANLANRPRLANDRSFVIRSRHPLTWQPPRQCGSVKVANARNWSTPLALPTRYPDPFSRAIKSHSPDAKASSIAKNGRPSRTVATFRSCTIGKRTKGCNACPPSSVRIHYLFRARPVAPMREIAPSSAPARVDVRANQLPPIQRAPQAPDPAGDRNASQAVSPKASSLQGTGT